jgi:glycogen synthase kinase 3 beta
MVAVKRVLQDKKYKNREIEIVNMLQSDFVMKVFGTYVTYDNENEYLNIIMDYYDGDLYQRISNTKKSLTELDIKLYSYQIFRSLVYIHSLNICHRDIKPHNSLVKGKQLVLCDFGSAKILKPHEANLPYICSRCYRAP